jgi:hypothetical protein
MLKLFSRDSEPSLRGAEERELGENGFTRSTPKTQPRG